MRYPDELPGTTTVLGELVTKVLISMDMIRIRVSVSVLCSIPDATISAQRAHLPRSIKGADPTSSSIGFPKRVHCQRNSGTYDGESLFAVENAPKPSRIICLGGRGIWAR